jgi:hypothetical protein
LLLVEPNRQLLYYYFLYILYTVLIANYYHFWYYYFNYTYYWLCRCPETYYIIYIFPCWAKRAVFIILLYNIIFIIYIWVTIIYIKLHFLSLILSIHTQTHTHTTHILALTGFARLPCPTPVECYIHYTHFTQVGRCARAVTRSS